MRKEIITRKADISDAYNIMKEPSAVTEEEAIHNGGVWACLKAMNALFETGSAIVAVEDGNPICLLGHSPDVLRVNVRNNWFIAKQRYFDLGVRAVVGSRRYLLNEQAQWPTTSFVSYSSSSHPDMARWFMVLGFREDLTKKVRGARVFVLRPLPSKTSDTVAVS